MCYPLWGLTGFEPEAGEETVKGGGLSLQSVMHCYVQYSSSSDQIRSGDTWSHDARAQSLTLCHHWDMSLSPLQPVLCDTRSHSRESEIMPKVS